MGLVSDAGDDRAVRKIAKLLEKRGHRKVFSERVDRLDGLGPPGRATDQGVRAVKRTGYAEEGNR